MIDKGSILVVDDTHESLKLLTDILVRAGHQVRPADSGELALASASAKPPELILLDINMPNMDGLRFLTEVKAQADWKDIAVVMITTEGSQAKVLEAVQRGASGYVRKPFTADEIKEKLAGIIS